MPVCGVSLGVIGDWVNYFTADMQADIYQRCIEPLQRRGLTFTDRPHWLHDIVTMSLCKHRCTHRQGKRPRLPNLPEALGLKLKLTVKAQKSFSAQTLMFSWTWLAGTTPFTNLWCFYLRPRSRQWPLVRISAFVAVCKLYCTRRW